MHPIKADRVLYTKCPLCESETISDLITGDCSKHPLYNVALNSKIQWRKCSNCDHIFTEGYYTNDALNVVFGKTHENQKVGGPIEKNRVVSSRMIEKVLPFVSEGAWLDVGFGNGSLLFTAQEYGFKPIGIDLRADNVNVLKSLGIEAHCEDLIKLNLPEKVSVISLADVLEHTPYPKQILVAANNLLKENGVLFLSMPNTESILWKVMNDQNQNPYWGELEHYHNFSRTRLYDLLREFGFEAVRYGISERYRVCMEVISLKKRLPVME
jgi:protein O-GlcNAc transferase